MKNPMLRCPLCQCEFERRETACARGCPLSRFCRLVRCPSCQFEFPEESRLPGWLRRLFHRPRPTPAHCAVASLCELGEGEQSEVACLVCAHESRRNTLAVYGLVPGSRITLQQKRPSYVVRVGETELALEADIAREIFVRRVPA